MLNDAGQLHRGRARVLQSPAAVPTHTAHGPNELWTWDITNLPSLTRTWFYYVYLLEHVISRKAVDWGVHDCESYTHAEALIERSVVHERSVQARWCCTRTMAHR